MTLALRPSEGQCKHCLEDNPLEETSAERFSPAKAYLSSQTTGRCQDCSQTYADVLHRRLLLRSWSARLLAVRRVLQDNRGKRTAGVDGVASLTPKQRWLYARRLQTLNQAADPVRRTYLTKPDGSQRPLGIPTMLIRAYQALIKLALEPEWEAVFEPNSYGFRPGRSPHDAIEAVFNFIRLKPKFVLKADIEKCFDKINHQALLDKLDTIQPIAKLVEGWLKAGTVDQGQTLFPEEGVPQGG